MKQNKIVKNIVLSLLTALTLFSSVLSLNVSAQENVTSSVVSENVILDSNEATIDLSENDEDEDDVIGQYLVEDENGNWVVMAQADNHGNTSSTWGWHFDNLLGTGNSVVPGGHPISYMVSNYDDNVIGFCIAMVKEYYSGDFDFSYNTSEYIATIAGAWKALGGRPLGADYYIAAQWLIWQATNGIGEVPSQYKYAADEIKAKAEAGSGGGGEPICDRVDTYQVNLEGKSRELDVANMLITFNDANNALGQRYGFDGKEHFSISDDRVNWSVTGNTLNVSNRKLYPLVKTVVLNGDGEHRIVTQPAEAGGFTGNVFCPPASAGGADGIYQCFIAPDSISEGKPEHYRLEYDYGDEFSTTVMVGTIYVNKDNEYDSNAGAGHKFALRPASDNHNLDGLVDALDANTGFLLNEDGSIKYATTDENGNATFTLVPYGSYDVVEVEAPNDYNVTSETVRVHLERSNAVDTANFKNDHKTGCVTFTKVEEITQKSLPAGTTFKVRLGGNNAQLQTKYDDKSANHYLLDESGNVVTITTGTNASFDLGTNGMTGTKRTVTFTNNSDGSYTLSGLVVGDYVLEEVSTTHEFYIKDSGLTNFTISEGACTTKKIENSEYTGEISITKLDQEGNIVTDLTEFKFRLRIDSSNFVYGTNLDNGGEEHWLKDAQGNIVEVSTNTDGIATFTNIPIGKYQIEEVDAPLYFVMPNDLKDRLFVVTVDNDGNSSPIDVSILYDIKNEEAPTITFIKYDEYGNSTHDGQLFTVQANSSCSKNGWEYTSPNGTTYKYITKDGYLINNNDDAGEYYGTTTFKAEKEHTSDLDGWNGEKGYIVAFNAKQTVPACKYTIKEVKADDTAYTDEEDLLTWTVDVTYEYRNNGTPKIVQTYVFAENEDRINNLKIVKLAKEEEGREDQFTYEPYALNEAEFTILDISDTLDDNDGANPIIDTYFVKVGASVKVTDLLGEGTWKLDEHCDIADLSEDGVTLTANRTGTITLTDETKGSITVYLVNNPSDYKVSGDYGSVKGIVTFKGLTGHKYVQLVDGSYEIVTKDMNDVYTNFKHYLPMFGELTLYYDEAMTQAYRVYTSDEYGMVDLQGEYKQGTGKDDGDGVFYYQNVNRKNAKVQSITAEELENGGEDGTLEIKYVKSDRDLLVLESKSPENYETYWDVDPCFVITTDTNVYPLGTNDYEVTVYNQQSRGRLRIDKYDEWLSKNAVSGVDGNEFKVYRAELENTGETYQYNWNKVVYTDVTLEDGTVTTVFKKGEEVINPTTGDTIWTVTDGQIDIFELLPVGAYVIEEVDTTNPYDIITTQIDVWVTHRENDSENYHEFDNLNRNVKLTVVKHDDEETYRLLDDAKYVVYDISEVLDTTSKVKSELNVTDLPEGYTVGTIFEKNGVTYQVIRVEKQNEDGTTENFTIYDGNGAASKEDPNNDIDNEFTLMDEDAEATKPSTDNLDPGFTVDENNPSTEDTRKVIAVSCVIVDETTSSETEVIVNMEPLTEYPTTDLYFAKKGKSYSLKEILKTVYPELDIADRAVKFTTEDTVSGYITSDGLYHAEKNGIATFKAVGGNYDLYGTASNVTIKEGDTFNPYDVEFFYDSEGTQVLAYTNIDIEGSFSTQQQGTYNLKYTITSDAGVQYTFNRQVVVQKETRHICKYNATTGKYMYYDTKEVCDKVSLNTTTTTSKSIVKLVSSDTVAKDWAGKELGTITLHIINDDDSISTDDLFKVHGMKLYEGYTGHVYVQTVDEENHNLYTPYTEMTFYADKELTIPMRSYTSNAYGMIDLNKDEYLDVSDGNSGIPNSVDEGIDIGDLDEFEGGAVADDTFIEDDTTASKPVEDEYGADVDYATKPAVNNGEVKSLWYGKKTWINNAWVIVPTEVKLEPETGTLEIAGLKHSRNYLVVEEELPEGYEYGSHNPAFLWTTDNDTYQVEVDNVTSDQYNKIRRLDVIVYKTNEGKNIKLNGAEFDVYEVYDEGKDANLLKGLVDKDEIKTTTKGTEYLDTASLGVTDETGSCKAYLNENITKAVGVDANGGETSETNPNGMCYQVYEADTIKAKFLGHYVSGSLYKQFVGYHTEVITTLFAKDTDGNYVTTEIPTGATELKDENGVVKGYTTSKTTYGAFKGYQVEIATDKDFVNIVKTVTTDSNGCIKVSDLSEGAYFMRLKRPVKDTFVSETKTADGKTIVNTPTEADLVDYANLDPIYAEVYQGEVLNGAIVLPSVKYGRTLKFTETKAPNGYYFKDNEASITISPSAPYGVTRMYNYRENSTIIITDTGVKINGETCKAR